jgi:hypothetical protein
MIAHTCHSAGRLLERCIIAATRIRRLWGGAVGSHRGRLGRAQVRCHAVGGSAVLVGDHWKSMRASRLSLQLNGARGMKDRGSLQILLATIAARSGLQRRRLSALSSGRQRRHRVRRRTALVQQRKALLKLPVGLEGLRAK